MKRTLSTHSSSQAARRRAAVLPEPPQIDLLKLPADILRLVFGFAPQWTRLRVLSVVNKRWRALALGTITSLDGISTERALDVLPNLTHLTVGTNVALTRAPTTLASLTLYPCPLGRTDAYLNLRGVSTLRLEHTDIRRRFESLRLLHALSSSLRSLTIHQPYPGTYDGLGALRLPSLTEFDSNLRFDCIVSLLRSHTSQLRTLRLQSVTLPQLILFAPSFADRSQIKTLELAACARPEGLISEVLDLCPGLRSFVCGRPLVLGCTVQDTFALTRRDGTLSVTSRLGTRLRGEVHVAVRFQREGALEYLDICRTWDVSVRGCLAFLNAAIAHLPRLRCLDLRRCVGLEPLALSRHGNMKKLLQRAAAHPTLEHIRLPPGLLSDDVYLMMRRHVPNTQL